MHAARLLRHPYAIAFAVAAILRLLAVLSSGPVESPDSAGYIVGADALRSRLLTDDRTLLSRPPGYPIFLAAFPSLTWVAAAQILLSAAIAAVLGIAAERHFGRTAGWVAAGLAAISPTFTQWTPFILSDTLALAAFAFALERTSVTRASRGRALVAGAITAASALVRPAYGISAGVLALAFLARHRTARKISVLFVVGLLLVPTAVVARNALATGRLVVYDSRGWESFWQGTQWNERGRGTAGIDIFYPLGIDALPPAERQVLFRERGLSFVREHPLDYLALAARKGALVRPPGLPRVVSRAQGRNGRIHLCPLPARPARCGRRAARARDRDAPARRRRLPRHGDAHGRGLRRTLPLAFRALPHAARGSGRRVARRAPPCPTVVGPDLTPR